jgi:lipopolysaccharide transport system permease protein
VPLGVGLVLVLLAGPALGVRYGAGLLLVPVAALAAAMLAWSASAVAAIANVYFRDVRYIIEAAVVILFYLTPVFYEPSDLGRLRWVVMLNPATGVLQLMRFALLGRADGLGLSCAALGGWFALLVGVALAAYRARDRVAVDRL